jgi:hypothetical protein
MEAEGASADPDAARAAFAAIPMTLIETSIKKFYLEDFHAFCASLGGETATLMCELLGARADMLSINITYNSLGSPADSLGGRRGATRASLFPAIGKLYPGGCDLLARCEDEDSLRRALAQAVPEYVGLWDNAPVDAVSARRRGCAGRGWGGGRARTPPARARGAPHGARPSLTAGQTGTPSSSATASRTSQRPARCLPRPCLQRGVRDISDAFFRRTVTQLELAFEGAFHYAPLYAYAKLKEQEVKNVVWIATCLEHGVYSELDRTIPVFSRAAKPRA